ncbi:hypothetical protein ACFWPK_33165 [Nocardia sp. NPDC058519]|uniref:hypothetical protein n=1 Tax=Nocardia sp. NPDC058519 TaxID=3346535 RepID=UPI003655B3B3
MSWPDPAMVVEYDLIRADLSTRLDHIVQWLLDSHIECPCDGDVDGMSHMITLAQQLLGGFDSQTLAGLLTEAVARLALSKEAQ